MPNNAIRNEYAKIGVDKFYQLHSSDYRNPHEEIIKMLICTAQERGIVGKNVIDLCCGSGEVTMALNDCEVIGVDPYTSDAYYNRTGRKPIPLDFKNIAQGQLIGHYDSVICSFALHLCPISLLPMVLWRLGEISNTLIIISPNKKPDCDNISGWILVDEILVDRVRMKVYCC